MSVNECYCYRGCCTEWEQEILLYLDRELPSDGNERVQRHLERCDECARFYRIIDREEQLLSGRLRHKVEMTFDPEIISELVMNDIPAFQPITFPQRVKEQVGLAFSFLMDRNRRHYSLAASILICVVGILFAMQVGSVTDEQTINIVRNGTYMRVASKEPIWINLDEGEFIELPDRSVLYATKDTCFSVDSYNTEHNDSNIDDERSLRLITGSLCIDVNPRPEKIGFSVVCPNAKATVFGTQFYISATTGPNKTTLVGVREGRVMVQKLGQNVSTLLNPKEMTSVSSFNGKVYLRIPYSIQPEIRKILDCFDEETRGNRSARRLLPVLNVTSGENTIVNEKNFLKIQ